jgi:hypothetical protein
MLLKNTYVALYNGKRLWKESMHQNNQLRDERESF